MSESQKIVTAFSIIMNFSINPVHSKLSFYYLSLHLFAYSSTDPFYFQLLKNKKQHVPPPGPKKYVKLNQEYIEFNLNCVSATEVGFLT